MNFYTGSMDYGHYYSYIKIEGNDDYQGNNGRWYCFNDSHYTEVICPKSSRDVINVFYKIKNI